MPARYETGLWKKYRDADVSANDTLIHGVSSHTVTTKPSNMLELNGSALSLIHI